MSFTRPAPPQHARVSAAPGGGRASSEPAPMCRPVQPSDGLLSRGETWQRGEQKRQTTRTVVRHEHVGRLQVAVHHLQRVHVGHDLLAEGFRRLHGRGADHETCPVSAEGGTRRVQLVRKEGRDVSS